MPPESENKAGSLTPQIKPSGFIDPQDYGGVRNPNVLYFGDGGGGGGGGDEPQIETLGGVEPDTEANQKISIRPRLSPNKTIDPEIAPEQRETPAAVSETGQPETSMPADTSIRPRLSGKTWDEHRRENREAYINDPNLRDAPENKPGRLTAMIGMGLKKLADALGSGKPLDRALGEGLGGAIGGAAVPKVFADEQNREQIRQIDRQEESAYERQKRELELKAKNAQIDDVGDRGRRFNEAQRNKFLLEKEKFNNRMATIDRQADIASGEAERLVKPDGTVWKHYKKADSSGNIKPDEQMFQPDGTPEMDPSKMMYDVYDPVTGQTVKGTGGEILGYSGSIQQGNANRQQEASKFNASQEFSAQKENANNLLQYNNQVLRSMEEASKADGKVIENLGEVQGIANEIGRLNDLLGTLKDDDYEGKNRVLTKLADLDNKYQQALGKTDAGKAAVEQLKAQGITKPQTVQAVKIQAVQIKNGNLPSVSQDVFEKRLSANKIPKEQWANIIAKAKADGVIK